MKVPALAGVEASLAFKDVADKCEELTRGTLLDRSLYYGALAQMDAVRLDPDIRIVVFIDDPGRCFPDRVVKLLENIKVALAQPGFVFNPGRRAK